MNFYKTIKVEKIVFDGSMLKKQRARLGFNANTFAKMVGISAAFLCDIEYNRRNPSNKTAAKIIKALTPSPEVLDHE